MTEVERLLRFKDKAEFILATVIWLSWLVLIWTGLIYLILHFSLLALAAYSLCWLVPALVIWCRI